MRPGRDADPSPPSSAEVKNRVELLAFGSDSIVNFKVLFFPPIVSFMWHFSSPVLLTMLLLLILKDIDSLKKTIDR